MPEQMPALQCLTHGLGLHASDDNNSMACARACRVPLVNRIPRFVATRNYAAAFGLQWKMHRRTQLDSYCGAPISRDRLARCLGPTLWDDLGGLQVLEAGCGAGRFTELLLERGAIVTSVDLSEAVDANQENFPQSTNHRVVQADILKMPFGPRQYDIVLCLGVVQHTRNPEETIAALYEQVKPSGWLVLDHYAYSVSYFLRTHALFRAALRRLSPEAGTIWSDRIFDLFYPAHASVGSSRLLQGALARISPVSYLPATFPELRPELQVEWSRLETHDALTDWFKHFRTAKQIRSHLLRLGLTDVVCGYGGNGVEARGRRPSR